MNFKIGMIFPGQGMHNINQIIQLNKNNNIIKHTFEEASDYLKSNLLNNLIKLNTSNIKKYIQSIIFTTSVSIYRLWKHLGGNTPEISAGHSLGEYSALVCSNAIKFYDGLKIIKKRETMMKRQTKGSEIEMQAIIGLKEHIILNICKKYSLNKIVNIAGINLKNQIIISGYKESVQATSMQCKKMGAKIIKLPIDIAAHCTIMKKIRKNFFKQIKKINIQKTKHLVINSISLKPQNSKSNIRQSLIKQLFKPVQWEKTMDIVASMSNIILEIGTNNILTNLFKKKYSMNIIPMNNLRNIDLTLKLLNKKL